MALTPAQRARRQAERSGAAANRTRNSQLLAAYAAKPSTVPSPKGPASTPAYQAPEPVGGRPLDWQEEAYRLSANRNLSLGNLDATYQRGQLDQEYGYGNTGAANPYSRAALYTEAHRRSKLGTTNQMAAAGQLHSGAYGRAQGENDRNYSISMDQNRRAYDQGVYSLNHGLAQMAAGYGVGVDDEAFAALLRSLGGK